MPNINARSPYFIDVTSVTMVSAKLELTIYNLPNSLPASPTYTFVKNRISTQINTISFNISNFLLEYMSFNSIANITNTTNFIGSDASQYCLWQVKRYTSVDGITWVLVSPTFTGYAFNGYGFYESGYNPSVSTSHLDKGSYYYYAEPITTPLSNITAYGRIRLITDQFSNAVVYTNLITNVPTNVFLTSNAVLDVLKVLPANAQAGNRVEFFVAGSLVMKWTFTPICEPKYKPIVIDFVNNHGAYQREYFFKASNKTFKVESQEYKLMMKSVNYNLIEGQTRIFNNNGTDSIKVNTGWVDESWGNILKQIMLSEKILINQLPAKLNTKSTELFKSINTKQINYSLEFEFVYDTINSVI